MNKSASWKASPDDAAFQTVRERIILSAAALIPKSGVAGLRLDAVARNAGIARSSLYRYFNNKHELIFELLEYEYHLAMEGILEETAHIEDPVERFIENTFRSVLAFRSDPSMVRLVGNGDDKTVSLIAFALREVPRRRAPLLKEWNFFAHEKPNVAARKNEELLHWWLLLVYSMVVFGNGALNEAQERQMLLDVMMPVFNGALPGREAKPRPA